MGSSMFTGPLSENVQNFRVLLVRVDQNGEIICNYKAVGGTKKELMDILGCKLNFKDGEPIQSKVEKSIKIIPLYQNQLLPNNMKENRIALLTFDPKDEIDCPKYLLEFKRTEQTKLEQYEVVIENLGNGAFGSVSEVRFNNKSYAMKVINIKAFAYIFQAKTLDEARTKIMCEAQIQQLAQSPYVIPIIEQIETNEDIYIIMELGVEDFQKFLDRKNQPLDPKEFLIYALQIAYGVRAVHHHGVIHRDLKPCNFVLCKDGSLKLTDFGGARQTLQGSTVIYTSGYAAPEIHDKKYTNAVDIYSLGCIFFQMLTNIIPEALKDKSKIVQLLHESPNIAQYKEEFKEILKIVEQSVQNVPSSRPTIDQIILILQNEEIKLFQKNFELQPAKDMTEFKILISKAKIMKEQLSSFISLLQQQIATENKEISMHKQKLVDAFINQKLKDRIVFGEICEVLIQDLVFRRNDIHFIKSQIQYLFDNFKIIVKDGFHYGEIDTGKPIEFRKMICKNYNGIEFQKIVQKNKQGWSKGDVIIGAFNKNGRNGLCFCNFKDVNQYIFEYQNDLPNGFGTQILPNGDKYEGQIQKGKLNGKGILYYQNGDIYDGDWVNDRRIGQGVLKNIYGYGDIFVGEWRDDKQNGNGVLIKQNGEVFEGIWENGELKKEQNGNLKM